MTFGTCEQTTSSSVLAFEENRSRLHLENPGRVKLRRIQVDGCLQITGARCDFLVISPTPVEHYIELKGADVSRAVDQLANSILCLSMNSRQMLKVCIIVSTRCPLLTSEIQEKKKRFKRDFNAQLIIKNRECYESVR